MLREAVISSNVNAVGYSAAQQILEVQFHPDRHGCAKVWQYSPVTPDEHAALVAAPSIGKALHALRQNPVIQERHVATITGDGVEVAA